ncbi:CPBP family intramembrane metalloprotease [Staphylococcus aureus]|nr:CPBP family intramembrane metalloprotease [Staphylococcus aureus]MBH4575255.1 CPBP family intramembrane metalloprotease [Staphylococcus aureus]
MIFAPIIEEFVYRGLALKYIFRNSVMAGTILMSIVFSWTHQPQNVIEFLIYFQSAILYSAVYIKTQRIELPILMHMINNSFTFIPTLTFIVNNTNYFSGEALSRV